MMMVMMIMMIVMLMMRRGSTTGGIIGTRTDGDRGVLAAAVEVGLGLGWGVVRDFDVFDRRRGVRGTGGEGGPRFLRYASMR